MDAADVIRIIETGAQQYFGGLLHEVRTNLGTTYYRRLSNEELTRRMTVVYKGLENWLTGRDESAVRSAGEDLGKRRFNESVPLGQVVLSLLLEEKYLGRYFSEKGVSLGEWSDVISDYFQKLIYHTGRGYEAALAYSNRLAQGGTPPADESQQAGTQPPKEGEVEVSRGGEIGEVSG
jgi:hypothetical protein